MMDHDALKACHGVILVKLQDKGLDTASFPFPTLCANVFPPHAVLLLAERWRNMTFVTTDVCEPARRRCQFMLGLKHVDHWLPHFGGAWQAPTIEALSLPTDLTLSKCFAQCADTMRQWCADHP